MSNWEHFSIYSYVTPTVVRLRVSKHTKMARALFSIKNVSNNMSSAQILHVHYSWMATYTEAHKRHLAMDGAGRRQRLASETAKEREARLHHGEELVEGSILHRRLPNSERHASLDVMGDAEQTR